MTPHQVAIFIEERKWDYRCKLLYILVSIKLFLLILFFSVFGFAAALLESIPIIGLMFTISNRVGAAMWAHGTSLSHLWRNILLITPPDLEKMQHFVASEQRVGKKDHEGPLKMD